MNKNSDPFALRGYGASVPWLDLVNSELWDGYGNFTDMLDDPAWLTSFLKFWHYRLPMEPVPRREFKGLRTLLRQLVQKAASGERLRVQQLQELNEWLKIAVMPKLVEGQNGLELALLPVRSGWPVIEANIASSFAQGLVEHTQGRLKICDNRDCRWVFIDGTRGNVRRWCSNATCGNRDRVRRARELSKQKRNRRRS